jgi:zinc transport system permease protein
LYLLLVSLIVSIGIEIVGTLLVGFLVIVPAAAAKNLSSNLFTYSVFSAVFGAISSFSGVLTSSYLSVQPGPMVVISGIIIFAATVIAKWKTK